MGMKKRIALIGFLAFTTAILAQKTGYTPITQIGGSGVSYAIGNGLSLVKNGNTIILGGILSQPTSLYTDAVNTFSIKGLGGSIAGDSLVVIDPVTGQVKRKNGNSYLSAKAAIEFFKAKDEYEFDTAIVNADFRRQINLLEQKIQQLQQNTSTGIGITTAYYYEAGTEILTGEIGNPNRPFNNKDMAQKTIRNAGIKAALIEVYK